MEPHKPALVVVAGPNGSGKTTLTRKILQHEWLQGTVYINADEIAQQELGDWNAPDTVLRAARIADERREACLAERKSFAYETVFSTPARVRFIERAIAAGYFVRFYFVGTNDPATNIRRVTERVGKGGHDVPHDRIVARYQRSMANLRRVLPIVDRAYIFDNSIDDQPAIRWARLREGSIIRTAQGTMPLWIEDAVTAPPHSPDSDPQR